MPDWVTHLGTTYIATRATYQLSPGLAGRLSVRHVLLGALLPDATRFTIILVDVLDWPAIATFTYFIPFHSLLIVALLAGAISLLLPTANGSSSQAFGFIMAGAALHFLMDDLEGWVGCGSTTFYPFYFGKPIGGWNSEGNFATGLLIIAAIAIGLALSKRSEWPRLVVQLSRRRVVGALALTITALIIPLFFGQWMIQRNAYYLDFVTNPAEFEGKRVELCFSEVIGTDPLLIEEFDTPFVLHTSEPLATGEWVSVRGIYRDGAIDPQILVRHQGFSDVTLSLIAAVAFIFLILDPFHMRLESWLKQ